MAEKFGQNAFSDISKINDKMNEAIKSRDVEGALLLAEEAIQLYLNKIGEATSPLPATMTPFAYAALAMHLQHIKSLLDDNGRELAKTILENSRIKAFAVEICPSGKKGEEE